MSQQPQPPRTRPYVLAVDEFEVVDDPNVVSVDDLEDVPPPPTAPTWADRLGLNEGTDSRLQGFLRGSGSAALDMAQGAASRVTGLMDQKLKTDQGMSMPQGMMPEAPQTTAGTIGTYLPDAASMAVPVGATVKAGVNAIPSAARAGETFQKVMGAAKNVPLDIKETGDVALRIMQLAERGGSMPLAVRKLLNRVTDPKKGEMLYEEGRDFASNISRLSANEFGRLTPAVAREVAELRVALNKANAMAAQAAGKGAEYKAAMKEYAQAMRLKKAVETATNRVLPISIGVAAAGAAGNWMTRQIRSALGGE